MFTIGVVVEGPVDKEVIPELVKKCRKQVRVVCRPCGGSVLGKLRGILDELDRRTGVDKLVVVCDADGGKVPELRKRMSKVISSRSYKARTKFVVAVQSLEAWLLADEAAVRKIAGIAKTIESPEKLRDAKSELRAILARRGIDYVPEIARTIAQNAEPGLIVKRCPSFKEFRQAIVDC